MIEERKIYINGIPSLLITCGETPKGVVLFYHGWSSTKEYQSVRGQLLAAYGYDVVIPDAVNHGERGVIDYNDEHSYRAFWQTIFQNLQEVPALLEYLAAWRPNVPLAVMGHSMGAMTAQGVMTHFKEFQTVVAMNGSGWWDESERRFRADFHLEQPRGAKSITRQIRAFDPYDYTEYLAGRSVLALNGDNDTVVNNKAQELYMDKLAQDENVESKFVTYEGLGHFVTTNMMGDAIEWLNSHLG